VQTVVNRSYGSARPARAGIAPDGSCPIAATRSEAVDLHKDGPSLDGVSRGVELVAIKPGPAVVGLPVMHPDHPEHHRFGELHAGCPGHSDNLTRPRYHRTPPLGVMACRYTGRRSAAQCLIRCATRRPDQHPLLRSPAARVLVDVERRGSCPWSAYHLRTLRWILCCGSNLQRVIRGALLGCYEISTYATCMRNFHRHLCRLCQHATDARLVSYGT
jgi:hypothetical protein